VYLATAAQVVIDGPGHVVELASTRCDAASGSALSVDRMPDPSRVGMRMNAPASCVYLNHVAA
jgi:hypothetical protein